MKKQTSWVKHPRGICAICKKFKRLIIDHDHETNWIRGLLCRGCNVGVGLLGDNLDGLKKAVVYLEIYEKTKALNKQQDKGDLEWNTRFNTRNK